MFLSLFSYFTEGSPVDIVLLQDLPSSKGFLPSFCGFKYFATPVARPRVACCLAQKFFHTFPVRPFFPPETDDFMLVDIFMPQACFGPNFPCFMSGNSCARPLPRAPHSLSPASSLLDVTYPYLVAGDFNIHNSATEPSRLLSFQEEKESARGFNRAADLEFTLLNTPGDYTRFL